MDSIIWCRFILLCNYILVWRIFFFFSNKLPTDDQLQQRGIHFSNQLCCNNSKHLYLVVNFHNVLHFGLALNLALFLKEKWLRRPIISWDNIGHLIDVRRLCVKSVYIIYMNSDQRCLKLIMHCNTFFSYSDAYFISNVIILASLFYMSLSVDHFGILFLSRVVVVILFCNSSFSKPEIKVLYLGCKP